MELPSDLERPFFTYGIFKPGQISHFRINDQILDSESGSVNYYLFERDGIPLLNTSKEGLTKGELIWFDPGKAEAAYEEITSIETDKQYEWTQVSAETDDEQYQVNVLAGNQVEDGGYKLEDENGSPIIDWNGRENDPVFNEALQIVKQTINEHDSESIEHRAGREENYFESYFRMHMAYLLLWTAIERYVGLRYGFGRVSKSERDELAWEDAFIDGLLEEADHRQGEIIRHTDDPEEDTELFVNNPEDALQYYYQVRSNLAHRGKSLDQDLRILRSSLNELYTIFDDYVLEAAFEN